MMCQRTWMYLETIFGSPDIVRQLPAAAKMFQTVDKSFRCVMTLTPTLARTLKPSSVPKPDPQRHRWLGLDPVLIA